MDSSRGWLRKGLLAAGLAMALAVLGACKSSSSGSSSNGSANGSSPTGAAPTTSTITLGSVTYTSAPVTDVAPFQYSDGPAPPDPAAFGDLQVTDYPLDTIAAGAKSWNASIRAWGETLAFGFPYAAGASSGAYTLGVDIKGTAGVLYAPSTGVKCVSSTGKAEVTDFGDVGGLFAGTVNVTAWDTSVNTDAGCPAVPVAGSFSVLRASDVSIGNDGSGTDTVSLTRTAIAATDTTLFPAASTYTESATVRNDPVITATYLRDGVTELKVEADGDAVLFERTRTLRIRVPGKPAEGTFTVVSDPGGAGFEEQKVTAKGTTDCSATVGTITVTNAGAVGAKFAGSLAITTVFASSGTGCPAGYSGTFSVTREPDE